MKVANDNAIAKPVDESVRDALIAAKKLRIGPVKCPTRKDPSVCSIAAQLLNEAGVAHPDGSKWTANILVEGRY